MRLFSTLGRLPGTWLALVATTLSGLVEGLGLALFIPLLEIMSKGSVEKAGSAFGFIFDAFDFAALKISITSLLVVITVLILGSQALSYLQNALLVWSQQRYSRNIRNQIVDSLFKSSWNYITMQSHGDIFNRLISETHRASNALRFEILSAGLLAHIVLFMGFSYFLSWQLLLASVVFATIVVVILRPLQRQGRELGDQTTVANKNMTFQAVDLLRGAKLVKASAAENAAVDQIRRHIHTLFKVTFKTETNLLKVYYIVQGLPVILLALVIGFSAEYLQLSASTTLVFLLFMARIAPRIAQFQQHSQGYVSYIAGLTAVEDLVNSSKAAKEDLHLEGATVRGLKNAISIENLEFQYSSNDGAVLQGVNMEVKRNQTVAIVGKSGSGKSTLIDLLIGLQRPTGGAIKVDGVPLSEIDLRSWRSSVGYVSQDTIIFNDTVRNNLVFAHPEASEELVDKSIQIALFKEVIDDMPEGMETSLGENGVRLSGGQKQRLSLARALIGQPSILLLDEATSALDNESEHLVQNAIEAVSKSMTVIIIAHRLASVRRADRIYLLERGKMVEAGTYEELYALGGRFRELDNLQYQ